jgi:hypothetical protein
MLARMRKRTCFGVALTNVDPAGAVRIQGLWAYIVDSSA